MSPTERLLLNHAKTPGFLAPRGEEFNPGPETRLDRSELLCNRVLLKYKIRLLCCFIIPSTEFKLSCNWLRLRNVEEKKSLSFPPPWEFQTPISSSRTPDPSLLRDPWTSYQPAYELILSKALPVQYHFLLEALLDSPASLSSTILKYFVPLQCFS